jgi:asparagine N-glycosylation enzyme membrane subunit Stt3
MSRVQLLVLGFFLLAWVGLLVILVAAPDVYVQRLQSLPGDPRLVTPAFVASLTVLIGVLCVGVLRRWRWTFWLVLIAFLAGVARVPASILELTGTLPPSGPTWYVLFQAVVGVVQFAIALIMLAEYRRAGVWGARH